MWIEYFVTKASGGRGSIYTSLYPYNGKNWASDCTMMVPCFTWPDSDA